MKRKFYNALQCSASCSSEPGASGGLSYGLCAPAFMAELLLPSVQSPAMALCLVWVMFGSCVPREPVWGCLGLELSQAQHLAEIELHQTVECFSCVVPENLLLVSEPVRPGFCCLPTDGATVLIVVCGFLPVGGVTLE